MNLGLGVLLLGLVLILSGHLVLGLCVAVPPLVVTFFAEVSR